jgi:hypothetical protein
VATISWPDELSKWDDFSDLDHSAIAGTAEQRRLALRKDRALHIINYDNIPWLLDELGDTWPFRHVVCDESSRLKSHAALRFRGRAARAAEVDEEGNIIRDAMPARRGLRHVAAKAQRWVNLSGTPAPNGLLDLWSQTYLLDGGRRLGRTITEYRNRWFRQGRDGYSYEPIPNALEEITARLSDICLTLDVADYVDLPELVTNVVYAELPTTAARTYRQLERQFFVEITGVPIGADNAAVLTNKLLQAANGALYAAPGSREWVQLHDAKLEALHSVIEEAAGANVIIAYNYASDRDRLRRAYPDAAVLDGNPGTVAAWNAGKINKLLLHPDSAGHGMNLQYGGNIMVFFGLTWRLESYLQAIERIGPTRQMQSGLDRRTFVHHIVARRTIDEAVMDRLLHKATVQEAVKAYMKRVNA